MLGRYDADVLIGEKVLAAVSVGRRTTIDQQIDRASVQLVECVYVHGFTAHCRSGRLVEKGTREHGPECKEAVLANSDPKRLCRGARIECFGSEQMIQVCHCRDQLGADAFTAWRQGVTVRSTHQQLVAELTPQPL
ncbi:Uncharacterised protein [Mycobacteroides abscessus subsp. massiliense]|nr:Uncharacterised protein [Mycobacteroides abscessus subsp. massiliense]